MPGAPREQFSARAQFSARLRRNSCGAQFGAAKPPTERARARLRSQGNCDEERGHCYCAGNAHQFQRPLPHFCQAAAHRTTKLPDGRPAYPLRDLRTGNWTMANMIYEKVGCEGGYQCNAKRDGTAKDWIRPWAQPFEYLYGPNDLPALAANPRSPKKHNDLKPKQVGYCRATQRTPHHLVAHAHCASCFEGQRGRFCEFPKKAWCLRDCSGHGRCDAGFCWCERGWFGVDCSQTLARADASPTTLAAADAAAAAAGRGGAGATPPPPPRCRTAECSLSSSQGLPSPAAALSLRMYVYEMPHTFTTRSLQYRTSAGMGLHRVIDGDNRSKWHAGSLYAMETALHEWLLDSPLRTHDPHEAQV